ncbi:hypothetical protein FAH67_00490 [Neisseria flavescens]|uniref:Uncharacterized protein n=1 Tax=Neisseria flavescens NRL30031/H210 TaxID=546264 RepID=C0EM15_NEIFL|nr:hypothetical protein NEIFLAOT_00978 [Neisseria flavescens NRL30031/H210]QCL68066.1 hypothetical protein FAH67_00490 [Neisseria flavescens]
MPYFFPYHSNGLLFDILKLIWPSEYWISTTMNRFSLSYNTAAPSNTLYIILIYRTISKVNLIHYIMRYFV